MSELGMALQSKHGSIDLQPAFLKQGQYLLHDTNLVSGLSPTRAEIGRNSGKVILVQQANLLLQVKVSLQCCECVEEPVPLAHQQVRLDGLHLVVVIIEKILLKNVWKASLDLSQPVSHLDTNQSTSNLVITELTVSEATAFAIFRDSSFYRVRAVLLPN